VEDGRRGEAGKRAEELRQVRWRRLVAARSCPSAQICLSVSLARQAATVPGRIPRRPVVDPARRHAIGVGAVAGCTTRHHGIGSTCSTPRSPARARIRPAPGLVTSWLTRHAACGRGCSRRRRSRRGAAAPGGRLLPWRRCAALRGLNALRRHVQLALSRPSRRRGVRRQSTTASRPSTGAPRHTTMPVVGPRPRWAGVEVAPEVVPGADRRPAAPRTRCPLHPSQALPPLFGGANHDDLLRARIDADLHGGDRHLSVLWSLLDGAAFSFAGVPMLLGVLGDVLAIWHPPGPLSFDPVVERSSLGWEKLAGPLATPSRRGPANGCGGEVPGPANERRRPQPPCLPVLVFLSRSCCLISDFFPRSVG
jgi:hypothetical protein